ncbi:MAG: hypothetical protein WDZ86_07455 [Gammaproteobacteria bacterium]
MRIDWHGRKLGYVPRMQNTAIAQLLDRGERLTAHINALQEKENPWQRIRFAVELG